MADQKVSELAELNAGGLDPNADWLLVSDMSALTSKKMKASEMIRASLPYLSTAWDFTTGTLLPTVSFTRASTGWRYNSAGVLVPETTDIPRFQYDPVSLLPRGLLVEDAATNLATHGSDMSNGSWAKNNVTVTTDVAVAPDGTTKMDKIVEDSATSNHYLRKNMNVVAGTTYVFEVFAKADGRDWLRMVMPGAAFVGGPLNAMFNLASGVVGGVTPSATTFITPVGGGIYRCVIMGVAASSTSTNFDLQLSTDGSAVNYTGDGASGVLVSDANLKGISCATSNIPTDLATVARAADVALISGTGVLADQCWIVKGRTPRKMAGSAVNVAFQVDDGTGVNRRSLRYSADGKLRVLATVGGVDQCDLDLGAVANDTDFVVAIRWANNNFAASLNGSAIVTDLSGQNPLGLTTARVGRSSGGNYWNSTIRTIETRRTASDAELPLLAA